MVWLLLLTFATPTPQGPMVIRLPIVSEAACRADVAFLVQAGITDPTPSCVEVKR